LEALPAGGLLFMPLAPPLRFGLLPTPSISGRADLFAELDLFGVAGSSLCPRSSYPSSSRVSQLPTTNQVLGFAVGRVEVLVRVGLNVALAVVSHLDGAQHVCR